VPDFLAAMAVVKVNYDRQGHDVLQMLVPFAADCARRTTSPLSDELVQRDLRDTFGLPVPRTVVKTLLHRLTRLGLLEREHGVLHPVRQEIDKPEYDLAASLTDVRARQAELLRLGRKYAQRVFGVDVLEAELSAALLSLVREEVAPLATWAVKGGPVTFDTAAGGQFEQIAAQYVLHIIEEGTQAEKAAIEQIAKGSLLSGVLWSVDVDAPDRRIEALELYLDTTLLLRLLGLCGPVRQSFSQELVDLATRSGVVLACFEHTRRELLGVLSAALAAVSGRTRSAFYGEAVEFIVSEGWSTSDVEEEIASLEERLADRGVAVRDRPERDARFTMDEDALSGLLNDDIRYTNPAALDADVDSLASIFVLRKGSYPARLETSRALFVTTNGNLAVVSRQLYKIGEDQMHGVPLALTESQVASYLWARNPGSAESLSMDLLAVGALSIAESEPKVWLKYVEKLEKLRANDRLKERDYVLLRQSLLARSILLNVTSNDPEAFTEDAAAFVLKHALAEHARDLQVQVEEGERELASRAEKLAASQERERGQSKAFTDVARRDAKRATTGFGVLLGLVLFTAAAVSFPWPIDPPLSTALPAWLSIALGAVAITTTVASLLVGFSVRGVSERITEPLTRLLERRYRARFNAHQ
jgi:hypothetical protein